MSSDEIWRAFETTPAPVEPVYRRDNDLAAFQRRLLGECAEKLDDLRAAYDALTDRHVEADRLLKTAYEKLHIVAAFQSIPNGITRIMEEIQDYLDA